MDVVEWLLDTDPAIRRQVMRDLTDAPADQVASQRARVTTEGWGARLPDLQSPDVQWRAGTPNFASATWTNWWRSMPHARQGTFFPQCTATAWTLRAMRVLRWYEER